MIGGSPQSDFNSVLRPFDLGLGISDLERAGSPPATLPASAKVLDRRMAIHLMPTAEAGLRARLFCV
jgi:hypothetical protein